MRGRDGLDREKDADRSEVVAREYEDNPRPKPAIGLFVGSASASDQAAVLVPPR